MADVIYALCEPETRVVRYIGKARDPQERLKRHLRDARTRCTPVYNWINKLTRQRQLPTIHVIQTCEPGAWETDEKRWIALARGMGVALLNVAEGGAGPFCPVDVRQTNARRATNTRKSTPRKAEIYDLKRNIGLSLAAGCCTEKTKERLRECARIAPHLFGLWASI